MKPKLLTGLLMLAALTAAPALATPAFPKAVRAGAPQFDDKDTLAEAVANPTRTPAFVARAIPAAAHGFRLARTPARFPGKTWETACLTLELAPHPRHLAVPPRV